MYNARGTLSKRSDTFFWSLGCVELLCFLSHLCAAPKSGFMLIIETWDGLRRSVTLRTECVQDESSYWTVGGFWNLEDQLDCALPIQNKQKCSFSLFHTCWQHCCTESTPSVCLNLKSIKLLQPTVTTAQDYHCIEHWAPSESYILSTESFIEHIEHHLNSESYIPTIRCRLASINHNSCARSTHDESSSSLMMRKMWFLFFLTSVISCLVS